MGGRVNSRARGYRCDYLGSVAVKAMGISSTMDMGLMVLGSPMLKSMRLKVKVPSTVIGSLAVTVKEKLV